MRLAFIIAQFDCGGAERVMAYMVNYWADLGHEVTLVTIAQRNRKLFFPISNKATHIDLNLPNKSQSSVSSVVKGILCIRRLRAVLKNMSPDAIISFIDVTNILVIAANLGLGIPVIVSERTDPSQWKIGPFWSLMRLFLYPFAAKIVVQTERAKSFFKGRLLKSCVVIPNPVCIPANTVLADFNKSERKRMVSLGRLIPSKGFDLLIEAFYGLASEFPEWDLHIYGEGPDRLMLQEKVLKLGLSNRIYLQGNTSEPFSVLKECHLFVFPSRYEGFPNALCEAMSIGLPVVSFDCPSGPREIMRDNIDGILVKEISSFALARAMRRMLLDTTFRVSCSRKAPEILNRYGINAVMNHWTSLTEEVVRNQ